MRCRDSIIITLFLGFVIGCSNQKSKEIITDSGLRYEILKQGNGKIAKEGDEVIVHETMGYGDGTVLYSTEGKSNLPKILIGGGQAVDGVDEGIRGMKIGEIRKLIVPPTLSKRKQYPKFLSPDSTLLYEIELVEIIDTKSPRGSDTTKEMESHKSGFEMVFVQGGEFMMGGDDDVDDGGAPELRIADECPHSVTVNDFYIAKYEVTQADWMEVMGVNPNKLNDCKECPVNQISWIDIQQFIKKANTKFDESFRLPTEEEWEFAAKGGLQSKNYTYSGSNVATEVAWYVENSDGVPHPVGLLKSNELGIYDMSGNIWEWCSNNKKPYPCDTVNTELKFESKVLKGGTFGNRVESVRVRDRNGRDPSMRLKTLGFRLAK